MLILYPELTNYAEYQLAVDDIHTLAIEESGNPDGMPVLVLQDGPGMNNKAGYKRFFDPSFFRIITFDYRGCGQSTPHLALENNTTQAVLGDLEKIRQLLAINQFLVFGCGWGSAIGLLYAQAYPQRVHALILASVHLARPQDIAWRYKQVTPAIFPDDWQRLTQGVSEDEQNDMVHAYFQRLTGKDELLRMSTAKAWATWHARCASLHPSNELMKQYTEPRFAMTYATLATYYLVNHFFLENNQILEGMSAIHSIPGIIVHGRYNMLSPLQNAWCLQQQWKNSELLIVRDAGDSPFELGMVDALLRASQRFIKGPRSSA